MWWRKLLLGVAVGAVPLAFVVNAVRPPTVDVSPIAEPTVAAAPSPRDADPHAVLARLDALRSAAYADPVHADPSRWLAMRCRCFAEERRRLADLAGHGWAVRGGSAQISELTVEMSFADGWRLLLVDVVWPYEVVDAQGHAVQRYAGRGPARWRVSIEHELVTDWVAA